MSTQSRSPAARGAALLALMLLGCQDKPVADHLFALQPRDAGASEVDRDAAGAPDGAGEGGPVDDRGCAPAVASDHLPARISVMQRRGGASASGVFTSDLFGLFQSNCGGCHVDNNLGGFQAKLATFPNVVTAEALARLTSDDPSYFMPPGNRDAFSKLGPEDPLVELARLMEAWLAAGKPPDVFYPAAAEGGDDPDRYLLDRQVGTQMTNLGNCIPSVGMLRGEASTEPDALDAMFAKAETLPERLEQTDLVTLDSEALAKRGVLAFAPAYTLWADDAKKIRHVRVPQGQAITFRSDTQQFDIPTNTRFYKTFLKRVVDLQGNESYRKMETRIIVSRPDEVLADGTAVPRALFGSYAWNEAETEAVLVRDPLRNGKPFRDRIVTYVTDEPAAEAVITTGPPDLQVALGAAGVTRTYAIPGSERCIQCHMGAPNGSFVLGFLPLQLLRRPVGQGGVIEPAERDELNQLQRLIDYGVIAGMKSPKDVVVLEDSQGDRKPRNEHELKAQGYMLGNCAHCHNPRGFPSRIAPELRDVLDFMPSSDGGIFQFPLERTSPRIFRGVFQNVPQPYITPSLYDRAQAVDLPDGTEVGDGSSNYAKKEIVFAPTEEGPLANESLLAPWRSLIYRNVDAPFTYEEDYSIYPRMPMHTPGYDCRVRRVLGSWMVSIPARMKPVDLPGLAVSKILEQSPHTQPYVEVHPGEDNYDRLLREAQHRVVLFEQSPRYSDCPDPHLVDTVDPSVLRGDRLVPSGGTTSEVDEAGNVLSGYDLRVPLRPHYAVTDLTSPPGDWSPRRPDWNTLLVDQNLDGVTDEVLIRRIQALDDVVISEALRTAALTEQPFGLWKPNPGCDLRKQSKVGDYAAGQRPRWMRMEAPASNAAVYSVSPGAEVFTQICQNCHGPEGDSRGRLAATIADMTGGQTRVANLRDGMFGPVDAPGDNRTRVFQPFATSSVTAEDWAARYLMFMGLGGTRAAIPTPALDTIRNGTVLGVKRAGSANLDVSTANMLSVPHALCRAVLPGMPASFVPEHGDLDFSSSATFKSPLIAKNGDYEMWRGLCAVDNEAKPVRVVKATTSFPIDFEISPTDGLRLRSAYPAGAPVGDHDGQVQLGVSDTNLAPWCIAPSADPAVKAAIEARWQEHAGPGASPPYCPESFLANAGPQTNLWSAADVDRWAARGAMNAGMAVFLYLDALAKGKATRVVPYDRCDDL